MNAQTKQVKFSKIGFCFFLLQPRISSFHFVVAFSVIFYFQKKHSEIERNLGFEVDSRICEIHVEKQFKTNMTPCSDSH